MRPAPRKRMTARRRRRSGRPSWGVVSSVEVFEGLVGGGEPGCWLVVGSLGGLLVRLSGPGTENRQARASPSGPIGCFAPQPDRGRAAPIATAYTQPTEAEDRPTTLPGTPEKSTPQPTLAPVRARDLHRPPLRSQRARRTLRPSAPGGSGPPPRPPSLHSSAPHHGPRRARQAGPPDRRVGRRFWPLYSVRAAWPCDVVGQGPAGFGGRTREAPRADAVLS